MTNVKLTDSERAAIATRNGVTADTPPQNVGEHVAAVYVINPSDGSPGSPGSSLTQAETQAAVEDAIAASADIEEIKDALTTGVATIDPILATATPTVINTGLNASQALWAAGEQPRVLYNGTSGPIYIRYGGAATIATPTYELAAGGSVVDSFAGAAQVNGAAGASGTRVITRLSA